MIDLKQIGSWQLQHSDSDWNPHFPSSDDRLHYLFRSADQAVDLFIAYYWRQREHVELIGWPNRIADEKTWFWISAGENEIDIEGSRLRVNTERLGSGKRRRTVWYWYWVDG